MGQDHSKYYSSPHLLHYTRIYENKLWVFNPLGSSTAEMVCLQVYRDSQPYIFGAIESISTHDGKVLVIGGMETIKSIDYQQVLQDK
jgi:hypothetical protein